MRLSNDLDLHTVEIMQRDFVRIVLITLAMVFGLPLLGAWLADIELDRFFVFPPPLEIPDDYPRFSWWAAGMVIGGGVLVGGWWLIARGQGRRGTRIQSDVTALRSGGWPWWGWLALGWTVGWWVLAWTRFPWFTPLQPYTFAPLWLGFIVSFNALAQRSTGSCLMLRAPGPWLGLFILSGLFWWGFEWLNRFVRNWHYLVREDVSATEYTLHASVCFSTVLPAVSAVREWLGGSRRLEQVGARGPNTPALERRSVAAGLFLVGAAGLLLTGVWPRIFYPALWTGPLFVALALALRQAGAVRGWWTSLARGDWRSAVAWALAALICGWFWEMWNFRSEAHWIYTVPYVQRWHVFEMPMLGYLGYLPFGLECGLAVALFLRGDLPGNRYRLPCEPRRSVARS